MLSATAAVTRCFDADAGEKGRSDRCLSPHNLIAWSLEGGQSRQEQAVYAPAAMIQTSMILCIGLCTLFVSQQTNAYSTFSSMFATHRRIDCTENSHSIYIDFLAQCPMRQQEGVVWVLYAREATRDNRGRASHV